MKIKYIFSWIIIVSFFACQDNEKSITDTEITVEEAFDELQAYSKSKGLTEEEFRLELDPAEKDKMMPIRQFEKMKQYIDDTAEGAIESRLRQKAYTEFEEELAQLLEAGSEVEVGKKIDNFDKEIAEKVKAWSKQE